MPLVERFNKVIFRPCKGLILKHQVVFGDKDNRSQKRKSELFRYDFPTDKYSDVTEVSSLTLDTSDFVIFERQTSDREAERDKVYVSYPHIFKIRSGLKRAMQWFYADKYENLFIHENDDIIFNSDFKEERIEMYGLVGNKSIILVPDVVEIETQLYEGVTMFLNSQDVYVQMTLDQLEALHDFFQHFDLYLSSVMVSNYVAQLSAENIEAMESAKSRGGGGRRSSGGLKNIPEHKPKKKKKKNTKEESE